MTYIIGPNLSRIEPRSVTLARTAVTDFDRLIDTLSQLVCCDREDGSLEVLESVSRLREILLRDVDREGPLGEKQLPEPDTLLPSPAPCLPDACSADGWEEYRREAARAVRQAEQLALVIRKLKDLAHSADRRDAPSVMAALNQRVASILQDLAASLEDELE